MRERGDAATVLLGIERAGAEQIHGAGVGAQETAGDGESGGFAGPVGADQAEDRAGGHVKVEAVQSPDAPVAFADGAQAQGKIPGGGAHIPPPVKQ